MKRDFPSISPLVNKAIETLATLKERYEAEIMRFTNGRVDRVTKRAALKEWMWDNGFEIPDTKATTLDELLQDQFLPEHIHGVVSRVRMAGRASTAKYKTIAYRASEDSRLSRHPGLFRCDQDGEMGWSGHPAPELAAR